MSQDAITSMFMSTEVIIVYSEYFEVYMLRRIRPPHDQRLHLI